MIEKIKYNNSNGPYNELREYYKTQTISKISTAGRPVFSVLMKFDFIGS